MNKFYLAPGQRHGVALKVGGPKIAPPPAPQGDSKSESKTEPEAKPESKADKFAAWALTESKQWEETVGKWYGIFPALHRMFQNILEGIATSDRKKVIDGMANLFEMLNALHLVLAEQPFGNPANVQDLKRAAHQMGRSVEIATLQADAARNREAVALTKLEESTQGQSALAADLLKKDGEIKRLTNLATDGQRTIAVVRNELVQIRQQADTFRKEVEKESQGLQQDLATARKLCDQANQELAQAKQQNEVLRQAPKEQVQQSTCPKEALETLAQILKVSEGLGSLYEQLGQQMAVATPAVEPPQVSVAKTLVIPAALHETLEAWKEWDGQMADGIRTLSEHVEVAQLALEEAEAYTMAGLPANAGMNQQQLTAEVQQGQQLIQNLLSERSKGGETLRRLQRIANAFAVVQEEVPAELLSLPKEVPDFAQFVSQDPEEQVQAEMPKASEPQDRRAVLFDLAKEHGISAKSLFLISLYDFLRDKDGKHVRKGEVVVLISAERAKLMNLVGCKIVSDFLKKWNFMNEGKNAEGYLLYCGSPGKQTMFKRTDKQLPWNPQEIFTQEEVDGFLGQMASKPVPAE